MSGLRGSIPRELADQQIGKLVEAIELGPRWEEDVLSIVSTRDEAESVRVKRQKVQERLRRLGMASMTTKSTDDRSGRLSWSSSRWCCRRPMPLRRRGSCS